MIKTLTEQQIRKIIENGTGKAAKVCEQKFYDKPKSLTEQWRDGTLRGCFYWKLPNGNICTAYTDTMRDIKNVRDSDEVEVLQETPSYVEYNELVQKIHILNEQNTKQYNELCEEIKKNNTLEKRLEIATKALEDILNDGDDYWDKDKAQEALTKMEGVK